MLVLGATVDEDCDEAPKVDEEDEEEYAFDPTMEFVQIDQLDEIPTGSLSSMKVETANP